MRLLMNPRMRASGSGRVVSTQGIAGAELKSGELRFVKRAVRVARTEIEMPAAALGKKFGRRRHHEQAEAAVRVRQIIKGVVVERHPVAFQIKRRQADLGAGGCFGETQDVGRDRRVEERIQPLVAHPARTELGVGVMLAELAAHGGELEFSTRDQLRRDVFSFPQDAPVLG